MHLSRRRKDTKNNTEATRIYFTLSSILPSCTANSSDHLVERRHDETMYTYLQTPFTYQANYHNQNKLNFPEMFGIL